MTPPPLQHPSWVTDPAPYKVKEEPRESEKRSESRNQSQAHQSPQQPPPPSTQQQPQQQVQNVGEITMRSATQSHTEPTPFHKHVKAVSRDGEASFSPYWLLHAPASPINLSYIPTLWLKLLGVGIFRNRKTTVTRLRSERE